MSLGQYLHGIKNAFPGMCKAQAPWKHWGWSGIDDAMGPAGSTGPLQAGKAQAGKLPQALETPLEE